jgi:hypothetical protein
MGRFFVAGLERLYPAVKSAQLQRPLVQRERERPELVRGMEELERGQLEPA